MWKWRMTKGGGAKEPDFPIQIIHVPGNVGGKGPNGGSTGATSAGRCHLMKGQFLDDEAPALSNVYCFW